MNTTMHIKMVMMVLLMFAASAVYTEEVDVYVNGGKFEDLSEGMKQKIRQIQKEFDNEGSISVSNKKRKMISISSDNVPQDLKESKNEKIHRNKYRESFITAVKAMKVDDKDSNSIKKAIDVYEKNGLKLFEKAGYPSGSGYSLKVVKDQFQMYEPLSNKKILEDGHLIFYEYYNGIRIIGSKGRISFLGGRVDCIALNVTAIQDNVKINNSNPEITFHNALKKYLSSSKQIRLGSKPTGELCYKESSNNSLVLCWRIDIYAYEDSKTVYINASTGKTEAEISRVAHAEIISGKVTGDHYEYGDPPKQVSTPTFKAKVWVSDPFSTYSNTTDGGYKISGLENGTTYTVQNDLKNDNVMASTTITANLSKIVKEVAPNYAVNFPWVKETYLNETNAFYHMNIVSNFYRNNFDVSKWTDPLSSGSKVVRCYTEQEKWYMGQAVSSSYIALNKSKNGPVYGMVIYHEYGHIMEDYLWKTSICDPDINDFEQTAIKEAINDFIACQIATQNAGQDISKVYGTSKETTNIPRDLENGDLYYQYMSWDENNYHKQSVALSGALWDFTNMSGVKWEVIKKLIFVVGNYFDELAIPPPYTFDDYFAGMIFADYKVFSGKNDPRKYGMTPHAEQLCTAFGNHGMCPAQPLPPDYCKYKGMAPMVEIVNINKINNRR